MSSVTRPAGPSETRSDGDSIVVGIPAYNEAMSIGSVVLVARQYADEVVVVDDGSTDGTGRIAREAGATVLSHERNRQKGNAIGTFLEYVDASTVGAVVLVDGDGQHHPDDIPSVAAPVLAGDADLVIGSRYLESTPDETPMYRRVGQRALDALTNVVSQTAVSDSQSGFRALSPDAVSEIDVTTAGMGVESELLVSAVDNDLAVAEAPIDARYESPGKHSLNPLRHGLSVLASLLRFGRDRRPLLFFGAPGLALALAGGFGTLNSALDYRTYAEIQEWQLAVSGVALAVGALLLACGLLWRWREPLHAALSRP